MRSADMTEPYGCDNAMEMLKSDNPPTAFLISSMISAIGVARAVGQCGLKTGKDVSIITHDDALSFLPNSGEVPIFTCTRSSVRYAGEKAAELLLNMISNPASKPASLHLDAELIIGQSTGPAPPRQNDQTWLSPQSCSRSFILSIPLRRCNRAVSVALSVSPSRIASTILR